MSEPTPTPPRAEPRARKVSDPEVLAHAALVRVLEPLDVATRTRLLVLMNGRYGPPAGQPECKAPGYG
jgi:hypothetical protein